MNILMILSLAVVFIILCLGLFTLFKGGDTAKTWSNRLMRYRVAAQFVAIIILMTALYFSRG